MDIDYEEIDRQKMLAYIKEHGETTVDSIIAESGATKLRIYPLLFKMEQEHLIEVTECSEFGSPRRVKFIREK